MLTEPSCTLQPVIRSLAQDDGAAAAEIFFDAVHKGTADVYSPEQREAWAGLVPNPGAWKKKFRGIHGFAAELDGSMVGFMTLDATGYIDLAFVRSDLSGRGIGQLLHDEIEASAVASGIATLTTEASKKAKPFFIRRGWRIDQEQVVMKNDVPLTNYKMSKRLDVR